GGRGALAPGLRPGGRRPLVEADGTADSCRSPAIAAVPRPAGQ
ncbi:hypothetical protein HMPREF1317_1293, partial [Schaalia georgiae F0490]